MYAVRFLRRNFLLDVVSFVRIGRCFYCTQMYDTRREYSMSTTYGGMGQVMEARIRCVGGWGWGERRKKRDLWWHLAWAR